MLMKNCVLLRLIRNHLLLTCSAVKNVPEAATSYLSSHSSDPWLSVLGAEQDKREAIVCLGE